jgi:hypothetical protein
MLAAGGSSRLPRTKVEWNMSYLVSGLTSICGLVWLVCFIMVLVKMFQKGQTVMGVVCILGICCGVGSLIALVVGWMNATAWGIQNLMYAYTGSLILYFILIGVSFGTGAITMPQMPHS